MKRTIKVQKFANQFKNKHCTVKEMASKKKNNVKKKNIKKGLKKKEEHYETIFWRDKS